MSNKNSLKKTIISFTIAGTIFISSGASYAALGDQVLTKGMNHDDVMILQQELKRLGYFTYDEITSHYGDITEKAVIEFQKAQGLETSGEFNSPTFEALKKFRKKPLTFERALKLEDTGEDVKALQEILKYLGYLEIDECTDYFGNMTKDAIASFQKTYEMPVDGVANARTIDAINDILLGRTANRIPNRGGGRNSIGNDIAATAKKYLGASYRSGGSGPSHFDCSGLTQYVYKQHGIQLSRSSVSQANDGVKVSKENLQAGDLLIFSNTYKSGPSHTGIYLGNGKFIHASTPSTGVIISDLNSGYYSKHFSYGRRLY
ncbi:C40 family peptidase [Tissierellaceae bacterium HCP3S3_D8]